MRAAVPGPRAARPAPLPLGLALAALLVAGAGARAQTSSVQTPQTTPLRLQQLLGRAERQEGLTWRPVSGSGPVTQGLRTGNGRAWLSSAGGGRAGSLLVGASSRLRVYRGEADLQAGQFLLAGPLAVHVLGSHLVLEPGAQARVDLPPSSAAPRVAVLEGRARLALGRVTNLQAGQQVALRGGQVTPFTGGDPWYAAQFVGLGRVTVQATRGPVYVARASGRQIVGVGAALEAGERLQTGEGAWAEIHFAEGGDLRLQASSELGVLGIQRTARGREVTLQLTRGSAWNVAQGGASLVGSALRGSVFQVGAAGLTQTFGAAPLGRPASSPAAPSPAPRRPDPPPTTGEPQVLTLQLAEVAGAQRNLSLEATSLPGARVSVRVGRRSLPLTAVAGQPGRFRLTPPAPALPEGTASVQVRAEWRGQVRTRTLPVVIDRTPPALSRVRAERSGRVLLLSGEVRDAGTAATRAGRLAVTVRLGGQTPPGASFTRSLTLAANGAAQLRVPLPTPAPGTPVRVTVRDEAGNETYALLP
ncbi:hypothetical protein [Deinococcus budaensis]|uniref:FecR protein domain-containing protein n=1 Tax=Deinococcus budaensis TaxID=1665626 RepID=A0A7W8GDI8_9DEIO|nr:hypothetical protein [Deinococcus budaensis]MBB5233363.1 hypothetical protein [Deinococcus budaensis]